METNRMRRLDRQGMIQAMDRFLNGDDVSEEEEMRLLTQICLSSPDPLEAMRYFTDSSEDMAVEEAIDWLLAMPPRAVSEIPYSEVPERSVLRVVKLED
jgi:hypothetical protein